jgi:hypothetical protein
MKQFYILAVVFAAVMTEPALADGQNNQPQAGGVNYSTVTQVGVNNVAGVAQGSSVDGSINDMRSLHSLNDGAINVDSQAYVIGSNVNSSGASITAVGSNNTTISNQTKAAQIITPLQ